MPCPRCAGTGLCPDCQGQGTQECPACAGTGTRQTSRGQTYNCKSCSGEGKVACPTQCSSCEGTGEITEELQKKARDRYALRLANFTPHGSVTRILVALNLAIFVLGRWNPELHWAMLLKSDVFSSGHYWEILTATFQHFGYWHLGLNMWFLWTYGPVVEGILGRVSFLAVYLGAGLTGSLISWAGHTYVDGSLWVSAGASGSLFALDGAMLALYTRWRMVPWEEIRSSTNWTAILLLGGIALEISGYRLVDNWAHAGGLLGGFLITAALPRPRGH